MYSKEVTGLIHPITFIDSVGHTEIRYIDTFYKPSYYTCNLDGSSQHLIPIALPAGLEPNGQAKLASGGTSIVFYSQPAPIYNGTGYIYPPNTGTGIYTCGIDGSGLHLILHPTSGYTGNVSINDAD